MSKKLEMQKSQISRIMPDWQFNQTLNTLLQNFDETLKNSPLWVNYQAEFIICHFTTD